MPKYNLLKRPVLVEAFVHRHRVLERTEDVVKVDDHTALQGRQDLVRPADEASADVWLHALATAQGEMHAAEIRANVIDAMVEVLLDVRERGHGQDEFGIVVYEHALRSRVGT